MKNIHILPTDKPSRLHNTFGILRLEKGLDLSPCNLNIYITNDEEIKEENWVLGDYPDNPIGKVISKYGEEFTMQSLNGNKYGLAQYDSKKIILTTDRDLIKNGVQAIDDKFLEWFVKNPSCEEVETERLEDGQYVDRFADGSVVEGIYENYKIIIPTEEPKQTVQEYEEQGLEKYFYELVEPKQERMYSEEEVKQLINQYKEYFSIYRNTQILNAEIEEWFEQIKKK